MFTDIVYLSLFYLEWSLLILFGKAFQVELTFNWLRQALFPAHLFRTKVSAVSILKNSPLLQKVFLLITDNWFFHWLRTPKENSAPAPKKIEEPRLILNNDLAKAQISYLNNNNAYTGLYHKKHIC